MSSTLTMMESSSDTAFFKIKPTKRSNPEERTTLDVIHQHQLTLMTSEKSQVPGLKEKMSQLDREIHHTSDDILRGQLENKMIRMKEETEKKNKKDRVYDYFLNTGDVLFQYYEMQDAIAHGASSSMMERMRRKPGDVLSALESAINHEKQSTEISLEPITKETEKGTGTGIGTATGAGKVKGTGKKGKKKGPDTTQTLSRNGLLETYLQKIDPSYNKKQASLNDTSDECELCGEDMIFSQNEATLYCTGCGCVEFILIDSDRPSYKDPPRESSYYAYKRINHFNELLAQFQAKETTEIPDDIFGQILTELKKQRITDTTNIKYRSMRDILRKLKLNRLYDHIPHIINRLNGYNTPVMNRETEEKLRHMFKEIQPSFQKHCPKNRRNFLSYAYVLYKFCELLELDEFLANFPLLKNRDKLYQQSKIWQKICEDMRWEFIASV